MQYHALWGGMPLNEKQRNIDRYNSGTTKIICMTNGWSRGIDLPETRIVINFDLAVAASTNPVIKLTCIEPAVAVD